MTRTSFIDRVQPLLGSSAQIESEADLHRWLCDQWDACAKQGPFAHVPQQASHANGLWGRRELDWYAALYPTATAASHLGFRVFAWYTSSIQQELIRTGEPDTEYFIAEHRDEGVQRLLNFVQSSEIITDQDTVGNRLRCLDPPTELQWILSLEYNSAVVSPGEDGLEVSAETDSGYLMLFVVDG